MTEVSRHTELEENIRDVLEEYLETKLFRDANIPEVNALFWEMYNRLADTAMYYTRAGKPNGYVQLKGSN